VRELFIIIFFCESPHFPNHPLKKMSNQKPPPPPPQFIHESHVDLFQIIAQTAW